MSPAGDHETIQWNNTRERGRNTGVGNATDCRTWGNKSQEHKPYYSSRISHRLEGTIRIRFKNINRFPTDKQEVKYDILQAECLEYGHDFDIQSLLETNRRWNILPTDKRLKELMKGWQEKPSYQIAQLQDNDKNVDQYGRVARACNKHLTSCKWKLGSDPLGRWTWVTFWGKKEG